MGNMSYCRFRNTSADLRDCYENMEDDDLGREEARSRVQLLKLCKLIADNYGDMLEEWESELKRHTKQTQD